MGKTISVALMCLLVAPMVVNARSAVDKVRTLEVCINGLAFVVVTTTEGSYSGPSVGITQVYVPGESSKRPPQPKICGN